jgi:hypothetical protein
MYDNLYPERINYLKNKYNDEICADDDFWEKKKDSKYAALIWLRDYKDIEPCEIKHKKGQMPWMCFDD